MSKYDTEVKKRESIIKKAAFLSLKERFLLWKVLVRSLFLYQAIVYNRLAKTVSQKLVKKYVGSIKAALSLPHNARNEKLSELVDFEFLWNYACEVDQISQ